MTGRAGASVARKSRDRSATGARQVANNGRPRASAKATRALKTDRMLELVASGHTVTEAAKELKISRKTGSQYYQDALAAAAERNQELRQHMLAQDLETLRQLLKRMMHLAISGDTAAARVVLGILDRRAKLLGLDAALKIEISNQRIDSVVRDIVDMVEGDDGVLEPELLGIETGGGVGGS
jgi:chemotaxis regulatin CheY-phosphate phosphatase CheZ